MKKALLFVLPVSALALDLSPRADVRQLEGGFQVPVIRFDDGSRTVQWTPPADWNMTYAQGLLTLNAKGKTHAAMEIRSLPRVAGDLDALAKTETLQQYLAQFFPATARGITYIGTTEGPFTIGVNPAREYLLTLEVNGASAKASVSFVEYNERERLVFVITARPQDFDEVRAEAIQSLFSWQTK